MEVSDVTCTVKGPVSNMISLQPVGLTVNPKHEPETEHLEITLEISFEQLSIGWFSNIYLILIYIETF